MLHWLLLPKLGPPDDRRDRHQMALKNERMRCEEMRILKRAKEQIRRGW